jgi:peptidoglycan/LPS O-acetylase OafA/YrhL
VTAAVAGYARFIDGLRAIAVLAVIAYHFDAPLLPGGFTGVDVFFVISGFVVSLSVSGLDGIGLPAFAGFFYARRLFRIAPALIVGLLVTTIFFAVLIPSAWLSGTNQRTGLAAFFGLSNFVLAQTDNDYFSPRVDFNPFTHTWSLAVEEQFYLIFPLLFIAVLRQKRLLSAGLFLGGFVVSLAWARWLGISRPDQAFYLIGTRFWELAAGVLLAQAMPWLQARWPAGRGNGVADLAAALSLAVLVLGLVVARPNSTPYPGGILPVLGTLGVLACLYQRGETSKMAAFLGSAPLRYVGKISYSLYLWHWPILVLLRWTCGASGFAAFAGLLAVFALASASYHFIETPPRRFLKRSRRRKLVLVGAGLAVLGAGYGLARAVWSAQSLISVSTVTRHAADWYPDAQVTDADFPGCTIGAARLRLQGGTAWTYARQTCGDAVSFPHHIFVIGDSHAAAYLAMLKDVVLRSGATVTLYGVGGCSFIDLRDTPSHGCAAFGHAAAADVLARLRPGDVVFLPSLRIPRIADQFTIYGLAAAQAQMAAPATAAARVQGEQAALPILHQFAATGAKIVFEAPTPVFPAPAFRCADWYDRDNPICAGGTTISRQTILDLRAPVMAGYKKLAQSQPDLTVWDPLPAICPGKTCDEFTNGHPLFFDGDHLSGYADRMLAPVFLGFLEAAPR